LYFSTKFGDTSDKEDNKWFLVGNWTLVVRLTIVLNM
jgi:hypothetical protein